MQTIKNGAYYENTHRLPLFRRSLFGELTDRLPTAVAEEAVIVSACQRRNVDRVGITIEEFDPVLDQFVDVLTQIFTLLGRSFVVLHPEFRVAAGESDTGSNEIDTTAFRGIFGNFTAGGGKIGLQLIESRRGEHTQKFMPPGTAVAQSKIFKNLDRFTAALGLDVGEGFVVTVEFLHLIRSGAETFLAEIIDQYIDRS